MSSSSNQRPPEPEIVKQWRKGPPKCCHTCEYYSEAGICSIYGMRPPDDFAASIDECAEWVMAIPF